MHQQLQRLQNVLLRFGVGIILVILHHFVVEATTKQGTA